MSRVVRHPEYKEYSKCGLQGLHLRPTTDVSLPLQHPGQQTKEAMLPTFVDTCLLHNFETWSLEPTSCDPVAKQCETKCDEIALHDLAICLCSPTSHIQTDLKRIGGGPLWPHVRTSTSHNHAERRIATGW